jgi:ketosteroid isomerase-like protein
MATTTHDDNRTAHLIELMTTGDDAFNARDWEAVDAVHHPDMVAHVTGLAEPIYGSEAHSAAMQQFLRSFPDMHVHTPYPIQFGSGDWITVITRVTGTLTGEMVLPDGNVIPPTGKAFDIADFGQTTKWEGDRLIAISAFWDSALQAQQIGLA